MKKTLFLLSTVIIFATTLQAMDQPQQPAAPEKSTEEQLEEANLQYKKQQTETNKASQDLQNRVHSFSGYTEQAAAKEAVALGFRIIDRGLSAGFDEARKRTLGLSEEEALAKKMLNLELEVQKESLKQSLLSTELTASSKKTKDAERANLKSQKQFQDLVTIEKLCALTYDHKNNQQHPDCLKMLLDYETSFKKYLSEKNTEVATRSLTEELSTP